MPSFASKLGQVIEKADESHFWLHHLVRTEITRLELVGPLRQEANELVSIFTKAHKTAKAKLERKRRRKKPHP